MALMYGTHAVHPTPCMATQRCRGGHGKQQGAITNDTRVVRRKAGTCAASRVHKWGADPQYKKPLVLTEHGTKGGGAGAS